MSIKQKAIKGALWTAIQNWVSQAGAFVVFFVLARLLQPEDFGLIALANVFLAFMQAFLEQGFAQALIQQDELDHDSLDTAFWSNVAIGLLLTCSTWIFADWIAGFFNQQQLAPILRCLSLVFLLNASRSTQQAILERNFAFKELAVRSILGIFLGGIVGITMAVAGLGVWSLVWQQITNEIVGTLVLWKASNWLPRFKFSFYVFGNLFRFGSSILALNLVSFFNTRINDFLIGYCFGPVVLGYYSISYRLLQVSVQLLVRTTSSISLPVFSRLRHDPQRFRSAYYTVTRLTSAIAFPFFLGIAVLAPQLVVVIFGEKWLATVPLIQILALSGILKSVTFFKSSVLIAMGKPAQTVHLKSLSVILNLIAFAIAYRFGIVAVTAATVMKGIVVFPIGQWVISRTISIPFGAYLRQFVSPLVSSLFMVLALSAARDFLMKEIGLESVVLCFCVLLGAVLYFLITRILSPRLYREFLDVVSMALDKPGKLT